MANEPHSQSGSATSRRWLLSLLPPAVAASALAWVLHRVPLADILGSVHPDRILLMAPVAVLAALWMWILVSASDRVFFRGRSSGPRLGEIIRTRGAVGLVSMLNFGAGQGGYLVWLRRRHQMSWPDASGSVLYFVAADLVALATIGSLGAVFANAPVPFAGRIVMASIIGVLLFLLLTAPWEPLGKAAPLFRCFVATRPGRTLAVISLRTLSMSGNILLTWGALGLYGIQLEAGIALSILPVIYFVYGLPVNILGFGAAQSAWLLFTPWAPAGELLAFSMIWLLLVQVCFVLRGMPFLSRFNQEILRGSTPPDSGSRPERHARSDSDPSAA